MRLPAQVKFLWFSEIVVLTFILSVAVTLNNVAFREKMVQNKREPAMKQKAS